MTDTQPSITFYCTMWCPDCRRARRFLDERGVAYRCVDIDKDPEAAAFVKQVNHGFRSVPTLVFPDGSMLVEPSSAQLAAKLHEQGLGQVFRS
jgi:mycoredoxin